MFGKGRDTKKFENPWVKSSKGFVILSILLFSGFCPVSESQPEKLERADQVGVQCSPRARWDDFKNLLGLAAVLQRQGDGNLRILCLWQ